MICHKQSVPYNTESAKICEIIYFIVKYIFSMTQGYFYTSASLGCIQFGFI